MCVCVLPRSYREQGHVSPRAKHNSLPLRLFRQMSFSGSVSPLQTGVAGTRGCLAEAIFRTRSVLQPDASQSQGPLPSSFPCNMAALGHGQQVVQKPCDGSGGSQQEGHGANVIKKGFKAVESCFKVRL